VTVVPHHSHLVICDLVIPCRDEAAALPTALSGLPDGVRAIVVDNGSRDGTADVARALGATVVVESRPGYGAAVHAGIVAAAADLVAVMDGDGSMDAGDLQPLIDHVVSGHVDLAVGRRRPVESGVWPWHARIGNQAVLWWVRRRTGLAVRDIAPMRVARRVDLLALDIRDRRFGYPLDLLVRAQQAGWVIHERDVPYRRRVAGTRSKVSGSVMGTIRVARDFARVLP
jgi:glycosyltransferase involved in cell wall biosynthesis